jgi:hypothetical protein
LKVKRHLEGKLCLHLQSRRKSQSRKQLASRSLIATCVPLGLFFDPEDEGNM